MNSQTNGTDTIKNENPVQNSQPLTEETSIKDEIFNDGKLTFLEILCISRYFLPLLASLGWGIAIVFNVVDGSPLMIFSMILVGIGVISALTVCPFKLISIPLKWAIRGFYICRSFIPVYGVADLFAAVFGTSIGFILGAIVVLALPAIFTIKKFYEKS